MHQIGSNQESFLSLSVEKKYHKNSETQPHEYTMESGRNFNKVNKIKFRKITETEHMHSKKI
jgi:hypothetical protein